MNALKRFARKHPVILFTLLAYAITWLSWTPISYGYDRGLLEMTPGIYFLYVAGSFGPLLAGAIATYLCGGSLRAWFGQALKWRVPLRWWLAAILIPLILYPLMAGIHLLLGGHLNWGEVMAVGPLIGGFVTVFLWGGGNEELGWRGFMLPQLQKRYGPLVSSLIIGVVWTLWHAPPGIIEIGLVEWALGLPFYMATITGISIVLTWLYNGSGGSVLLAMVFHAWVNAGQGLYFVEGLFTRTGDYARLFAWLILVLVLVLGQRRLMTGAAQQLTPASGTD